MATGTGQSIDELEYSWYSANAPSTPDKHATIPELKRMFFINRVGEESPDEDVFTLERRWLQTLTGVSSEEYDDAWREAVVGQGLPDNGHTVLNRIVFYQNVDGGTV